MQFITRAEHRVESLDPTVILIVIADPAVVHQGGDYHTLQACMHASFFVGVKHSRRHIITY
jgi:hypothetical protein